jgi:adenine-specific DNA-methyltransferase
VSSINDVLSIPKFSFLTLEDGRLNLLENIGKPFKRISDFCTSSTGIVTGANSFFIVNNEVIRKYRLRKYAKPIIQKGEYVKNHIVFTQAHFDELVGQNKNAFLLHFEKDYENEIPKTVDKYLTLRKDELLERHKIGKRNPWYRVPNVNASKCIFFKRSHEYPKLIYNNSDAYVTDIGYKVDVYNNYDVLSFIFCFYNSLTLCMAELEGRSYAGGVLELTPREFKNLLLPYTKITKKQFAKFVSLMENGNLENVLNYTDKIILEDTYNIEREKIETLREMRKRFVSSRIKQRG